MRADATRRPADKGSFADDAEIALLTKPSSTVSVGVATHKSTDGSSPIQGQYTGVRANTTAVQLDLDINTRDEAIGKALYLKASNLGLDNQDLSISYEKQGAWKLGAEYSDLVHRGIRTINTGMVGAGTTTPSVARLASPGTGADLNLSIQRKGMGLSMEKWFSKGLQFEVSFKNKTKTGSRLFGTGYACANYVCNSAQTASNQAWALLMLAEPIDSSTKQIEAKLNYHDKKLTLTGGYYGSYFTNANGSISTTVPNQLNNPLGAPLTLSPAALTSVIAGGGTSLRNVLQMPVALNPDNAARQFYVSGSYRFTTSTNGTFKYATSRATQDEDYAAAGLTGAPVGVTNLGGVVETRLAQLGLTTKISPQLGLLANVRYNVEGGPVSPPPAVPSALTPSNVNRYWNNYHVDSTKLVGKLEANYRFGTKTRGTVGVDYNMVDRPVPIAITEEELGGIGALRSKNFETGYRLELRSTLSESLSGSVGYGSSKRTGNDWTSLNTSAAFVAAGLGYGATAPAEKFLALSAGNAFPMNMADVDRTKFKLGANWMPNDKVDVQLMYEDSADKNVTPFNPVALGKGWRESSTRLLSVDVSYVVSDDWKVTAYGSSGTQHLQVNHSTGYMANIKSPTDSFGLGLTGNVSSRLEVGAQLTLLRDTTQYGLQASPTTSGTLPNINHPGGAQRQQQSTVPHRFARRALHQQHAQPVWQICLGQKSGYSGQPDLPAHQLG